MDPFGSLTNPAWPPGTVRIEGKKAEHLQLRAQRSPNSKDTNTTQDVSQPGDSEVVLQPRPTKDPNDPLVITHCK